MNQGASKALSNDPFTSTTHATFLWKVHSFRPTSTHIAIGVLALSVHVSDRIEVITKDEGTIHWIILTLLGQLQQGLVVTHASKELLPARVAGEGTGGQERAG